MKWNKENPIYNQHVTGKIKNPRKKKGKEEGSEEDTTKQNSYREQGYEALV